MHINIIKCVPRGKFVPFSWIVRASQGTKWSHYAFEYEIDGKKMVSDAVIGGIREMERSEWLRKYEVIDVVPISLPCNPEDIREWVSAKLGTKYSLLQNIGIGLITIGILSRNPFGRNLESLVCHEWCLVTVARFAKIEIGDSDNYDFNRADEVFESRNEQYEKR